MCLAWLVPRSRASPLADGPEDGPWRARHHDDLGGTAPYHQEVHDLAGDLLAGVDDRSLAEAVPVAILGQNDADPEIFAEFRDLPVHAASALRVPVWAPMATHGPILAQECV